MKLVGMITWLVTALASIAIGLKPFGYNLFELDIMHPQIISILHYGIGIFGIVSLLMLLGSFGKDGCGCHSNTK